MMNHRLLEWGSLFLVTFVGDVLTNNSGSWIG